MQERRSTRLAFDPPAGDGLRSHPLLGSAVEAAVVVVQLGDVGVAATESEAGVAFPVVVEAVDSVEFDGVVGVDEEAEHAASADGGELHRIADEDDSPLLAVGERCEFGELRRGGHSRFVDDEGRAGGQVVAVVGWTVAAVLDEQLVERVGDDAGLVLEHLGSSSGRRHAEHWSTGGSQLGDSGSECGGLAGAGGTDDEDELLVAGDSGCCVGLGDVEIDVGEVDCCGLDVAAEGEAVFGPIEQIVFLVEDGLGGQRPVDGRLGDGATVGSQERIGWDGR